MKKFLFIPVICLLFTSCANNSNHPEKRSDHCSRENHQMQSQPSDWEITASVKKNLMTEGSLSSSARMISVTTNNGVVTLKGTVANKEEERKVVRMAKDVNGVRDVDNQLTISSR